MTECCPERSTRTCENRNFVDSLPHVWAVVDGFRVNGTEPEALSLGLVPEIGVGSG